MLLTTEQASALIAGATSTKVTSALRVLRAHGLHPVRLRGRGHRGRGGQYRLTVAQVVAVLLFHCLAKLKIDDECRYALLLHIGRTPDEQLEAKLASGQHFVCRTGRRLVPELWREDSIDTIRVHRADTLRQLGLEVEAIDIRPFVGQLFEAARTLTSDPATTDTTTEGTAHDA